MPAIDPNDTSTYSATDNNTPGNAGDYFYTVNILLNANGVATPNSYDPDIDNQGSPVKISKQ